MPEPGDTVPAPEVGPTAIRVVSPDWCPNGHRLERGNVTVGWTPCHCPTSRDGGHYRWHCWTCQAVIYGPPHDADFVHYPGATGRRASYG